MQFFFHYELVNPLRYNAFCVALILPLVTKEKLFVKMTAFADIYCIKGTQISQIGSFLPLKIYSLINWH